MLFVNYHLTFGICQEEVARVRKGESGFWGCALITASGSIVVIYTTGGLQLMAVAGLSLGQALVSGVVPFLVGDFLKLIVGAQIGRRVDAHRMK